jgi:hypothetical protein
MSQPGWLDPKLAALRFQSLRRDKDLAGVVRELP